MLGLCALLRSFSETSGIPKAEIARLATMSESIADSPLSRVVADLRRFTASGWTCSLARAHQWRRRHIDLLGGPGRSEPLGDPALKRRAEVNEKPAIFPAQNFHWRAARQRHDQRSRRARRVPDVE